MEKIQQSFKSRSGIEIPIHRVSLSSVVRWKNQKCNILNIYVQNVTAEEELSRSVTTKAEIKEEYLIGDMRNPYDDDFVVRSKV